jgi:predicted metalloprotease with PDZ domain
LVVFGAICHEVPKTSVLAFRGSLKNSQDDVMSAFFAEFERSFADLTAMYWVAMCVTYIGSTSGTVFKRGKGGTPELKG